MKRKSIEVIPSAYRLIKSLRDIGYDFEHAISDLVDNSLAAGAKHVAIEMHFEGNDSWIRISDDGEGMSEEMLTEAMRFGSNIEYDSNDLGKFGLGLKTASFSQCHKFTVASRVASDLKFEIQQWDLAHIKKIDKWHVLPLEAADCRKELLEPMQKGAGTVVLWENLDRIMGYKIPWGDRAKKAFLSTAEKLDLHLGMVFHRYLSGEAKKETDFRITINGTNVRPWDPFARDEIHTITFDEEQFEVHSETGNGLVGYKAYILPPRDQFSRPEEFNRLSGPAKWNHQQGFYIYRNDRLIQSGGWCRTRAFDEHSKLARIAIDFYPDLDSAFELNVSKAKVNLPADLKMQLKPYTESLLSQAKKVYAGEKKKNRPQIKPTVAKQPSDTPTEQEYPTVTESHTVAETSPPFGTNPQVAGSAAVLTAGKSNAASEDNHISIGAALEKAAEAVDQAHAFKMIKLHIIENYTGIADELEW